MSDEVDVRLHLDSLAVPAEDWPDVPERERLPWSIAFPIITALAALTFTLFVDIILSVV